MVSEVSILIPVFNYHITSLVKELTRQCQKAAIQFEIICLDDASESQYQVDNRPVQALENVVYEELPVNISRAAMRNALAHRARFAYFLFLDNDSVIISDTFILTYLQSATKDSVYIGGTIYQLTPPPVKYRLHWHYGRHREQKSAAIRQKQPYRQLQVNNFFIRKTLYQENPLPEVLQAYGHEDTLWGSLLEKAKVPVCHLDNPVLHAGLEPTLVFLKKTEQAVRNLTVLVKVEKIRIVSALTKAYSVLKKLKLITLFLLLFKIIKPLLLKQLQSPTPKLICYDLLKLGLLASFCQKNK